MHRLHLSPGHSLVRAARWPLLVVFAVTAASGAPAPHPAETNAPPVFADAKHIPNGCHISTLAFLARFAAAFPGERGQPLVTVLPNAGGLRLPHTVAVITWRGDWWGRDGTFGVFPLRLRADTRPDDAGFSRRLARELERHAQAHLRRPDAVRPIPAPKRLPADEQLAHVLTAMELLPMRARVFRIASREGDLAAAFFRPAPGMVAVYLPTHGTCVAHLDSPDDLGLVKLALTELGYTALEVRAEPAATARPADLLAVAP